MASKNGPYTVDDIPFSGGKIQYAVIDANGQEVQFFSNGRSQSMILALRSDAALIASSLSSDDATYLALEKAHDGLYMVGNNAGDIIAKLEIVIGLAQTLALILPAGRAADITLQITSDLLSILDIATA